MTTLIQVLDTADPFDGIVIEASGVGDPWSIAEIALVEPELALHAVIVLVDAERICALVDDARLGDTIKRQVRAADLLLLNKVDLVDDATRVQASARLATLKPAVPIVPTTGAVLPEMLIDASATSAARRDVCVSQAADHEAQFHRILYRRRNSFDRVKLEVALSQLPPTLLRLKGFCTVSCDSFVLQVVGARWSLAATAPRPADGWAVELAGVSLDASAAEQVAKHLDVALAQNSHRLEHAFTVAAEADGFSTEHIEG